MTKTDNRQQRTSANMNDKLAEAAYDAYHNAALSKGGMFTPWENIDKGEREVWYQVALAVVDKINQIESGH